MRNRFDDGGFAQDPATDILPDDQNQTGLDPNTGGGSTGGGGSFSDLFGSLSGLLGQDWAKMGAFMGLAGLANQSSFFNAPPTRVGYQGGIPQFTATREQTPYMQQRGKDYRPGQGGVTYFTPMQYQYSGGNIGIPATNIPGGQVTPPGGQQPGGQQPGPGDLEQMPGVVNNIFSGTQLGWKPGVLKDFVTFRNPQTNQYYQGPSDSVPPGPGWERGGWSSGEIDSGFGRDPQLRMRTVQSVGRGQQGAQFPLSYREVADMARQAAAMNPNVAGQGITSVITPGGSTINVPPPSSQGIASLAPDPTGGLISTNVTHNYGPGRNPVTGRTPQEELEFQALVNASKASDRMTADQRAQLKKQFPGMTWLDETATTAPAPAPAASAGVARQYTTDPKYGTNIQFDQFGNWGAKTGTLEDKIFRAIGEAGTGRYTSQQITPDEVKGYADKIRAGTLKESDIGAQVRAADAKKQADAEKAAKDAAAAKQTTSQVASYFKKPESAGTIDELAQKATYKVQDNEIRSGQIGVRLDDRGQPGEFVYYDEKGTPLTMSAFLPSEFLKFADKFNINPTDLLGIEKGLDANNIGFRPYEYFEGTGSSAGFDIRDFLSGGLGTANDWTKDLSVGFKGPTAQTTLDENKALAAKYGLKYNEDKYKGGQISQAHMSQLQSGTNAPRKWAALSTNNNIAGWYDSKEEADAAAKQYGGKTVDLSGSSVTSQDNRNNLVRNDDGTWKLKPGGASGGLGALIRKGYAVGGLATLPAAGGRFLRGPGDGTSDSIPARFQRSGQEARLADGEFVIDARTVSELGNGSSEAGARKLYAMMDRVHNMRKKAKRGKPSGADKHLPA